MPGGRVVLGRPLPELDVDDVDCVVGCEGGVDRDERHQDAGRNEHSNLRVVSDRRGTSEEVFGEQVDDGWQVVEKGVRSRWCPVGATLRTEKFIEPF